MAEKNEVKRVTGPTEVTQDKYDPQQGMTEEQANQLAEQSRRARERAMKKGTPAQRYLREQEKKKRQTPPAKKEEPPLRQEVRPKADVRIKKVPPKKVPPKKAPPPKKDLTEKQIGGLKQQTIGQRQRADVDVRTGQPKTWLQRAKAYVTRKEIPGARPPRTMEERALSIGRTARRGIGGVSPAARRRPGGIIDIEAERVRTKGPMGKTQRPLTPRPADLTVEERKRRGMPVTAAMMPGTGKGATPIGPTVRGPGAAGPATVKTIKTPTKTHLGEYRVRGYVPPAPPPKPRPPAKKKRKIPERAPTFMEMVGGIFGKKK